MKEKIEKNHETIIVGKRWKKEMVVLPYVDYIKLKNQKETKKNPSSILKFAWALKKTKLVKLKNDELKSEYNNIKFEDLAKKNGLL